jgi:2-keto-3-deoxy-L-rhamnonate aldolase RhmA
VTRIILQAAATALVAVNIAASHAQIGADFDPDAWEFGPRWTLDGDAPIWNPVMRRILRGEPIIGGTIRATDPRTYCAMAAAGYDFTWVEMQHEAISWEQVARMWRTCPGPAVPGVRVPHESEGHIQMPADMGALVIIVPTIDTVEQARRAVGWTYFPPLGRRSAGGGQAFESAMWGQVPGGYRASWNDNVVLILMIETLEGVKNAREIAKIPGVDGLFAASGDIGNFSGYGEGDPEYERLITEIVDAAVEAGKFVCGPLRWMGARPEYTCFQGGTEAANIRRGAQAEIQSAAQRFTESAVGGDASALIAELSAACGEIVYESDCYDAVRRAAAAARVLPVTSTTLVLDSLSAITVAHPALAEGVREIAAREGLVIEGR